MYVSLAMSTYFPLTFNVGLDCIIKHQNNHPYSHILACFLMFYLETDERCISLATALKYTAICGIIVHCVAVACWAYLLCQHCVIWIWSQPFIAVDIYSEWIFSVYFTFFVIGVCCVWMLWCINVTFVVINVHCRWMFVMCKCHFDL